MGLDKSKPTQAELWPGSGSTVFFIFSQSVVDNGLAPGKLCQVHHSGYARPDPKYFRYIGNAEQVFEVKGTSCRDIKNRYERLRQDYRIDTEDLMFLKLTAIHI